MVIDHPAGTGLGMISGMMTSPAPGISCAPIRSCASWWFRWRSTACRPSKVDDGHQDRQRPVHYTDWTIGHVHAGALGWVAMITIGSMYHLIPKVFGREQMHSIGLINAHFWLATIGTVLYIASMWVNGITQGLMWRAINEDGT